MGPWAVVTMSVPTAVWGCPALQSRGASEGGGNRKGMAGIIQAGAQAVLGRRDSGAQG